MNNLLHNWPFLLSQTGLALAAVFGVMIIHITTQSGERKHWYYYVFVWLSALLSAFQFANDANRGLSPEIAQSVWMLRIGWGLERLAVYFSYQYAAGRILSPATVAVLNRYVALSAVLMVVSMLAYNAYHPVSTRMETDLRNLTHEVRRNRAIAMADTARENALLRTIADLQKKAQRDSVDKLVLNQKLNQTNARLLAALDLLVSLKQAVNRLGVSVERTRKSVVVPNAPTSLSPTGPAGLIPTDRVKAPIRKGKPVGYDEDEPEPVARANNYEN